MNFPGRPHPSGWKVQGWSPWTGWAKPNRRSGFSPLELVAAVNVQVSGQLSGISTVTLPSRARPSRAACRTHELCERVAWKKKANLSLGLALEWTGFVWKMKTQLKERGLKAWRTFQICEDELFWKKHSIKQNDTTFHKLKNFRWNIWIKCIWWDKYTSCFLE